MSPSPLLTTSLAICTLMGAGHAQTPGSFSAFGAGCPPPSGSLGAEFYEFFSGPAVDLANLDIELMPIGGFGYQVQPCTTNCFFGGFTTRVFMSDDQVIVRSIPFTFPHPGGSSTSIGFCSNGYLWLTGANFNADFTPSVAEFLNQDPRLAPLWTDLNPAAGGQTYCDVSATNAVFTWNNVPEFGASGNLNTFQVQLFPDGRVVMSYRSLRVGPGHSVLVGYSRGGGVADPGATDISTSMPFTTGSGTRPPILSAMGNPTIGQTLNLVVGIQPSNSVAGFLVLGDTQLNVPLSQIGMPNCTQYTSLDTSLFFAPAQPSSTIAQPIPNAASLVGVVVYAQAALFSPGANPLGVATSHGGQITIGN